MSEAAPGRAVEILQVLYDLTCEMVEKQDDVDFLLDAIARRQALMDECDALRGQLSPEERVKAQALAKAAASLDETIRIALANHREQAKNKLAGSASQQKILGYTNNAISSSGSYMDYKK